MKSVPRRKYSREKVIIDLYNQGLTNAEISAKLKGNISRQRVWKIIDRYRIESVAEK